MRKQIIISVGRENGSGGHQIAQIISEKLGIALYDKKLVNETVEASGFSKELVDKLDEKPVNFFTCKRFSGYSNSLEEIIAEKTFELLKGKADAGESFVVVGRCTDYILRDNPNLISIFISDTDKQRKINRIMKIHGVSESQAAEIIRDTDRRRKLYHNFYSDIKWGDSRGYDLLVNSGKFGIEETAKLLLTGINAFKEQN